MSKRHATTETEAIAFYGEVEDVVFRLFKGLENAGAFFDAYPKLLDNLYAFSLAKYEAGWAANHTACIWYNRNVYKKLQKPPQAKAATEKQKPVIEVAKIVTTNPSAISLGSYYGYCNDVEPEIMAARGKRGWHQHRNRTTGKHHETASQLDQSPSHYPPRQHLRKDRDRLAAPLLPGNSHSRQPVQPRWPLDGYAPGHRLGDCRTR